MKVKDYMTIEPIVVSPSTTFREMIRLFDKYRFDTFPVVDKEKRLLGIISRTDLLKIFVPPYFTLLDNLSFIKDFGALEISEESVKMMERLFLVNDLMTTEVVTVDEETSLFKAIVLMIKNRVRSLPVLKGVELVGIISRTDILKAFLVVKPD